jgi:GNAT superfamily N-acetyltransferase
VALLRLVKPDDLTAAQFEALWDLRLNDTSEPSNMSNWLRVPQRESLVALALDGDTVIAWGLVSRYRGKFQSQKDPLVISVFVREDRRGKGIGRALFDLLNFETRGQPLWAGFHDKPSWGFWAAMMDRFWPTAHGWGHAP